MKVAPFKKGMRVVRLLNVCGVETATISTVERVSKGRAQLEDSEHTLYDAETGYEDNPPIPGCSSRLVKLEEGE